MNLSETEKNEGRYRGRCRRFRFLKIPLIAFVIFAKGALVMLLWNALIPDLFHGPELIYWQALGLMVLAKLLVGFGGFGRWGGHHHPHRFGGRHRWMHMTQEEREKLRDEFRKRCEG